MFRTLLAVVLAAAILAVAVPVVEEARVRRSDRIVRGEIAAVERAATGLLAADETTPGRGARRTVVLDLPEETRGSAATAYLSVRGASGADRAEITYRIQGGAERRVVVDAPLSTGGRPFRIDGGGRRRLVLRLIRVDGDRRVRVQRGRSGRSMDPGTVDRDRPDRWVRAPPAIRSNQSEGLTTGSGRRPSRGATDEYAD